MAKKNRTIYVCQSCGHQAVKWMGRCPDCGQWDSMVEEFEKPLKKEKKASTMTAPETIDSISLAPEM